MVPQTAFPNHKPIPSPLHPSYPRPGPHFPTVPSFLLVFSPNPLSSSPSQCTPIPILNSSPGSHLGTMARLVQKLAASSLGVRRSVDFLLRREDSALWSTRLEGHISMGGEPSKSLGCYQRRIEMLIVGQGCEDLEEEGQGRRQGELHLCGDLSIFGWEEDERPQSGPRGRT